LRATDSPSESTRLLQSDEALAANYKKLVQESEKKNEEKEARMR